MARTSSTTRCAAANEDRSARIVVTSESDRELRAAISSCTDLSRAALRPTAMMRAPLLANSKAAVRPKPDVAPVISTTRPDMSLGAGAH